MLYICSTDLKVDQNMRVTGIDRQWKLQHLYWRNGKTFKQVNGTESLGSKADIYGKSAIGDLLTNFIDTQTIDSTVVEIYATA